MNFFNSSLEATQVLSMFEILVNLGLAFIMGLLITGVYRLTNRNQPVNQSFFLTLIILSMVVALVMMVIGNSIARAFSLVGALSIIRFRTVVKDNRDIAYVFFALAAGMAAGIGNYAVAIYGVGFISFLLLVLDFVQFGVSRRGIYLLRFQMFASDSDSELLEKTLKNNLRMCRKISVKTLKMGQYVEYSYMIKLKQDLDESTFINNLNSVEGIERINLIAENEHPSE